MEHETEVEPAAYELVIQLESVLVHFYRFLVQLWVVNVRLLEHHFGLPLESKALTMPQFWIVRRYLQSLIVIHMRRCVIMFRFPIQEYVPAVEIDRWIGRVFLKRLVEVLLCLLVSFEVVVGQSPVIVMHTRWLETNGLRIVDECLLVLLLLEQGQSQIVMN